MLSAGAFKNLQAILRRWVDDNILYSNVDVENSVVLCAHRRFTIAQINAGVTLLSAIAGFKYRMVDAMMIAIGGNVTSATSIIITGTQAAGSKTMVTGTVGNLTQNAVNGIGRSAALTIPSDGLGFAAMDANTPVLISKTGSAITVATHVDFTFWYSIEKA